jgi:hypothetical protein
MKKIVLLSVAALLSIAVSAENFVVKPNGWKAGDSRSYDFVKVSKNGEIGRNDMSLAVSSVAKDKYLIDYKSVSDSSENQYKRLKMMLGDSIVEAMNNFVYKVSLSKDGEFGHFENYKDMAGLFGSGLFESVMTSMIGTSQEDAENKIVPEIKDICWYMNKKFDSKKENVFKRDFTETITVFKDVEVKVRAGAQEGKVTFVMTADLSEEIVFAASEKALKDAMNEMAKAMGIQMSAFEGKLQEKLNDLKQQKLSMTIKETVVFDEETGWLISYDKVTEGRSASEGVSYVESRRTITAK